MDNNNLTPQTPIANPPQPVIPQNPNPAPSPGNKMILWFVIGLVVVAGLVGGIYLYLSRQTASTEQITAKQQTIVQPKPSPEETIDALDRDLNSVDAENPNTDFVSIDQDLQQL